MMRFNYAVLLIDGQVIASRATSKGWKIISPRQLPGDKGRSVCVIIGGAAIMGARVSLPAAREAEVRRAAPFAIEEEIASDIAETHFAIGPKLSETSERDIRVVSNSLMDRFSDALETHGLKNAPIICVADVLDDNTLLEAGGYVYGRLGRRTFSLDANLPADVFIAMTQGVDSLAVHGDTLAAKLGLSPAQRGARTNEELLVQIAQMDVPNRAVNLRQGAYSVTRSVSKRQLLDWRRSAALIGLAFVLWFANLVTGTRAIEARTGQVQAAANRLLSAEFPEAGGDYNRVLDLYKVGVGDGVQPLPSVVDVTALLYKSVDEIDTAEIRSFRYDAKRNEAICVISAQDFGALEVLSDLLTKGGLVVSGGDARQDRGAVVGEFKLGAS